MQLLASLNDTVAIVAVDHEDDTLRVLEVVPPERSDLVLPTDIPHGELDVLVLDGLDVEAWHAGVSEFGLSVSPDERTDSGNRRYDFTQLQLVQDSRFTGGVQADH